jgi:BirA family transcriptional regulator, biotin operon repressor / biotin---[acetyl-CoA-carboxylase] ligase
MNFRVHHYDTVDSTMRIASELEIGDVVVADEQTAGQGRHGHSWHSPAGTGLYCSIVLPPTPLLTLALGLATAHVIPATCDLRWPNDVMLGGRKIAGILVHLAGRKAIAGIGINVNQTEFPPELEATSLKLATGHEMRPGDLLDALLASVESYILLDPDDILTLFTRASSYAAGRRVSVALPDGVIHGVTRGLTPDGYLMLRQDDGTDTLILAGGVRAAGA